MNTVEERLEALEWKVQALNIKLAIPHDTEGIAAQAYSKHLEKAPKLVLKEIEEEGKN